MKTKCFNISGNHIKIKGISGTFLPSKRSLFLASFLTTLNLSGKKIIDVGSGSGFLSILCAKLGAVEILALDINPAAIFQTRENWKINDLPFEKLTLKISNVFDELKEKKFFNNFDLIISNPPGLPSSVMENLDKKKPSPWIWNVSGNDGRLVVDKILMEGRKFLKTDGQIILAHSSRLDFEKTKTMLKKCFPNWSIVAKKNFMLERHFLPFINFWKNKGKGLIFSQGDSFFEEVMLIKASK